ncbi:hypothetical protein HPB49_017334 [Dermacentor silvarum]|uniref:Uncharacterized protein n=1 Tax=Dermacentor silvarum TaxID=543639 RepID=A0ACB8CS67_DERSI|nr:hypothetical protein HPB49_017334 [Dermacentor silvarum]
MEAPEDQWESVRCHPDDSLTIPNLCALHQKPIRVKPLMFALRQDNIRLYKDYATITWTINGRLLKNLIDRSTLSTVKNDGPVKVSKIAINQLERLRSDNGKFVFECTALSTCRSPRQPSRLVPSSRTRARATPSASLAGPREARAATPTSYPIP